MTTDEKNVRDLDELIAAKTYQGMTDEEIDRLIEWHKSNAYAKGNADAVSSQGMINALEFRRKNDELVTKARYMLESLQRDVDRLNGGEL